MKILKPYCASGRHVISCPILEYKLATTKDVEGLQVTRNFLDGWNDIGNNNTPELSLESAGIMNSITIRSSVCNVRP